MISTPKGKSGLFLASSLRDGLEDSNIKQVTTLLENKEADPNVLLPMHGITPFHLVIGNVSEKFAEEVTELFLRHGGNPNVKSSDGMTPVHVAAAWGRPKILELLLSNGGDPLDLDDDNKTPFHYAFDGSHYEAITILGKYCNKNQDDNDDNETGKVQIKLEKILINRGDVIAEYLPSEIDLTNDSSVDNDDDNKDIKQLSSNNSESDCDTVTPTECTETNLSSLDDETNLKTNNITFRRHQTHFTNNDKSLSPILPADEFNFDLKNCSNADEKLLVEQIISRLSSSIYNPNDDYLLKNEKKKFSGFLPKPKFFRNNLNSSKDKHVCTVLLDNSIISKSPNFKIPIKKKSTSNIKQVTTKNVNAKSITHNQISTNLTPKRIIKHGKYQSKIFTFDRKFQNNTNTDKFNEYNEIKTGKVKRRIFDKDNNDDENHDINAQTVLGINKTKGCISPINRVDRISPIKIEKSHTQKIDLESPGSSHPTSASYLSIKSESDIEEELKIWNELNEIYNNKTQTPLASVSRLDNDSQVESFSLENIKGHDLSSDDDNIPDCHQSTDTEAYGTPLRSTISSRSTIDESFVSVDEEYGYIDAEKDVAFLERRLRFFPKTDEMFKGEINLADKLAELSIGSSGVSSRSSDGFKCAYNKGELAVSNTSLRHHLIALGDTPGPITDTTYHVYLKRLYKLKRNNPINLNRCLQESTGQSNNSRTLRLPRSLLSTEWMLNLQYNRDLEEQAFREYENPNVVKKYRGGIAKTSFNYLLLDPRITKDLPRTGRTLTLEERWKIFLEAIFYIGKGKAARPLAHLYDAFDHWTGKQNGVPTEKIQKILDIWRQGNGVVCLQIFMNTMQEEAFNREAAMIDTLGTNYLSNCNRGTYYGLLATISSCDKKNFGKYLLYKAMEIFMHEGERQQFPRNIE